MALARIPWNEVQDVIKETQEFHKLMLTYHDLVEKKQMPADVAENLCANLIIMIHSFCAKTLRASNIQTSDQVESQKRIETVLQSIVKVQRELINKGENSRIQILLSQTMTDIASSINGIITQETESILQEFKNNFQRIENQFAELKKSIDEQGKQVIVFLRNEMRARDEQLKNLVESKNQFVGDPENLNLAQSQNHYSATNNDQATGQMINLVSSNPNLQQQMQTKEESKLIVVSSAEKNDGILPCFSFYNDVNSLEVSDLQFKRNYKWQIVSPISASNPPIPVENMKKYEVNLKLCTLYKGVPYGPAYMEYTHPSINGLSFDGVGVFTEGRLHMGPFLAIDGKGLGHSISQMINGRPADSHYCTQFFEPEITRKLESLEKLTQVEGMQFCSTQSQEGLMHGHGKISLSKGRVFIGEFKQDAMSEGKLYEMQKDKTYTLYQVKYDYLKDKDTNPNVQVPAEKIEISKGHTKCV